MGNNIAAVRVFPQTKLNPFSPRIRKGENICVRAPHGFDARARAYSRIDSPAIIGELTRWVPYQILVRRRKNLENILL